MSLIVCNLTGTDVVLVKGTRSVTAPAKVGGLTYGPPVNITSELKGLVAGDYTLLEAQRPGVLAYFWDNGIPMFAVGTLTVGVDVRGVTVQATAATITPIVEARQATFLGPAVQDLISVVAAVLPSNVALTIIANTIDYARKLQVRIVTGSTAGTLTLVGVGVDGQAVTQAIDISTSGGTRTVVTTDAYRSLTTATISGGSGFGGTVGIGLGLGLAMPTQQTVVTAFGVVGANCDKLNEAVGTVDATAHTIEPTTPSNGTHNYTFDYKYTTTPVSPTHTHTLA